MKKVIPNIKYFIESPWATVSTLDGEHKLDVSLTNLCYDEDGGVYLLACDVDGNEMRLYLST